MRLLDAIELNGPYDYLLSHPLAVYYLLHGMVAIAVLVAVPSVFTRVGPALGAYVAVSLYVPLSGNALEGIGRYVATLFPVFMLIGTTVRSRRVHETILVTSALMLSLLSALFVTGRSVY